MGKFLFGAGRRNITPKVGARLTGYRPDLVSESVNDELTATAFYFKKGDTEALLVSVTLCVIESNLCARLLELIEEKCGIKKEGCILHAIHTHSGPNLMGSYGWGDIDTDYLDGIFIPALIGAVNEAKASAKAAKMAVRVGESLVGVNRREHDAEGNVQLGQNPDGPFDKTMTVISFKDERDEPIANIIHYGAHATAAGGNKEISRDWPGVMIDGLEKESGALTAFINGPEGDVGPRLTNGKTAGLGDIGYAMRLGACAAQDAVGIYNKSAEYSAPSLTTLSASVKMPLLPRISLEEATEEHKKYEGKTVNIRGRFERYYKGIIDSYSNGYEETEYYETPQTVIRLGEVAIVATPYELFSEIGLKIKEGSNIPHVLILSNANGSQGYLSTEVELPFGGYEINMFKTNLIQEPYPNTDRHFVSQTLENLSKTEK